MTLKNTLELPGVETDPETKFKALIYDNKHIVFVVIGSKKKCKTILKWADLYANSSPQGVKRKVVWLANHSLLKDSCLELLKTSNNFKEDQYNNVLAFVLSPQKHQAKYIFVDDPVKPDKNILPMHIGGAYAKASELET